MVPAQMPYLKQKRCNTDENAANLSFAAFVVAAQIVRACFQNARGAAARDFGWERVVPIIGRSGRNIPAAGYDGHDNEAPSQKTRRPKDI